MRSTRQHSLICSVRRFLSASVLISPGVLFDGLQHHHRHIPYDDPDTSRCTSCDLLRDSSSLIQPYRLPGMPELTPRGKCHCLSCSVSVGVSLCSVSSVASSLSRLVIHSTMISGKCLPKRRLASTRYCNPNPDRSGNPSLPCLSRTPPS